MVQLVLELFSEQASSIINLLSIVVKQYIYHCRCQNKKPSKKQCESEIIYLHNIQLFNTKKMFSVNKHKRLWARAISQVI